MSVVALPRRSARLALKRAAAFKAFNEDFRLDAPVSVRSKIMTAFAKAAIAQIKHYGGFKMAPIDDPARAPAPVVRRSRRLNTEAYKAATQAKKSSAQAEDKELSAYLKSEALKRSHAKNRLFMEYYRHPTFVNLRMAENKARQQLVLDCASPSPDSSVYRSLVQDCILLASLEYQRAVDTLKPKDRRIEHALDKLFLWDAELKLLNGECD